MGRGEGKRKTLRSTSYMFKLCLTRCVSMKLTKTFLLPAGERSKGSKEEEIGRAGMEGRDGMSWTQERPHSSEKNGCFDRDVRSRAARIVQNT